MDLGCRSPRWSRFRERGMERGRGVIMVSRVGAPMIRSEGIDRLIEKGGCYGVRRCSNGY